MEEVKSTWLTCTPDQQMEIYLTLIASQKNEDKNLVRSTRSSLKQFFIETIVAKQPQWNMKSVVDELEGVKVNPSKAADFILLICWTRLQDIKSAGIIKKWMLENKTCFLRELQELYKTLVKGTIFDVTPFSEASISKNLV